MTDFRQPAKGRGIVLHHSGKALAVAALTIALAALLGFGFLASYRNQIGSLRAGIDEEEQRQTRLTGLDNPRVSNMLDTRYVDADGDLVADAPKDASQLSDPATLKFSYIPQDDNSDFKAAFKELLAAISKATGKPVEYQEFSSTDDELVALRDGDLQVAGFNTGAVPEAVCQAGFVPLVQMADASGNASYQMEIIATPDSKITDLKGLRGHELTLTEPTSNSGYKAPLVILRDNGMIPPRDFLLRFSQGHLASIQGIKNKQFEAAAVANDVLHRELSAGHISDSDYHSVFKSDHSFPPAAIGYAYNLKPELAAKIKDTIANFDWKGSGLEKDFGAEGKAKFIPVNYKSDWDYVRRIDDSIGYVYRLRAPAVPTTQK